MDRNELSKWMIFFFLLLIFGGVRADTGVSFEPSDSVRMYYVITPASARLKQDKNTFDLIVEKSSVNRVTDRPFKIEKSISQNELIKEWTQHKKKYGNNYAPSGTWVIGSERGDETEVAGIEIHDLYLVGSELHLIVSRSDLQTIKLHVSDFRQENPGLYVNKNVHNSRIHLNFR